MEMREASVVTEKTIIGLRPDTLFQAFKYCIYFLIFLNVFYWLYEDYTASGHTFREGVSWRDLGNAFAASVDTIAWFILLMTFELETYVISDEKLKGWTKYSLNFVAGVCYFFIGVAFVGYLQKLTMSYGFDAASYDTACHAVGQVSSYVVELDEYVSLNAANCGAIGTPLFHNNSVGMVADGTTLIEMHRLAATDVVNAGTWILIVVVLWIDVFLQLRGSLTQKFYNINIAIKLLLYGTLLIACGYWGYLGDAIGFWDAFLWILAFFFIELNLFKWHEETTEEAHTNKEVAS